VPGPVEVAAYFVVAEALTNVAKYAQASEATVTVRRPLAENYSSPTGFVCTSSAPSGGSVPGT
jgi:hypothetical protein